MTDPIADMLTRIRNAVSAKHTRVDMPASRLKAEIARILEGEEDNYGRSKQPKPRHDPSQRVPEELATEEARSINAAKDRATGAS